MIGDNLPQVLQKTACQNLEFLERYTHFCILIGEVAGSRGSSPGLLNSTRQAASGSMPGEHVETGSLTVVIFGTNCIFMKNVHIWDYVRLCNIKNVGK